MDLDLYMARIGPFWRVALLVSLTAAISALSLAFTSEKTTFLFKEELHLSVSAVGTLKILLGIPLYLQPFMGAWSDLFPFLGYHRRSYFILASATGALGFLGLSLLPQYHYTTVACLLLVAIAGGTLMGVMVNAVMVTVGNLTGTFGILQSLAIIIPLVMSLTYTSHLGGYVTQHWSYQHCFQVAALLFLVYAPLALLIDEPQVTAAKPTSEMEADTDCTRAGQSERTRTAAALRQAATDRSMWAVVGFVFYLIITPGIFTAQIYFMTDVLHFSKQFIGDLGRFDAAGQIVALAGFMAVSRFLPVRVLVWGAWLMDCLSYPAQMLLHDATSAKFVKFFSSFIGLLYSLCLNVLAAKACPPGIEGTIYGLVMAVIQSGGVLSEKFGGVLYDYFGPL
ncbi:MAG: MFS transporter, partial [Chroococcidiopsidaceae cyanobacterium CP_BM_RX_35]|nr:MFS transporter [Chroococcidiopsidaceae cyanobacterium CP_BM_RX_35]